MILIQMIVNKYMERIDINQMVEKNIEKANVKRVKKGQKPLKAKAVMNVRTIEEERELEEKKEAELKERVTKQVESEYPDAYRETLVVLDATTGQNALVQAREFSDVAKISANHRWSHRLRYT